MDEPVVAQEPIVELPSPHVAILRRVGVVLLAFFALHFLSLIIDLMSSNVHSYSLDLGALILGILLFRGSLGAARFMAFMVSAHLAAIAAMCVVFPIVFARILPSSMWHQVKTADLVGGVALLLFFIALEVATSVWILRELRREDVADALARAHKKPLGGPIRVGVGVGGGLVLLVGGTFLLLAPIFQGLERLSEVAKARASAQVGQGYEITVERINSFNDHWRAHVKATHGSEVKELDLSDTDEPTAPSQP